MTESTSRHPAYTRLLDRVIRILAMHDHSEQELRRKPVTPITGKNGLEEIDAAAEDHEHVIVQCHEHGYLDDSRFIARPIASRNRKGYGLTRIRQELNRRGVSRKAIKKAMRECDIDWYALARDRATRKYGEPLPTVFSRKIKIQRFLLYHSHLMEDVQDIQRNFAD